MKDGWRLHHANKSSREANRLVSRLCYEIHMQLHGLRKWVISEFQFYRILYNYSNLFCYFNNEYTLESYRNMEFLKVMFESSVGSWVPALLLLQLTNTLPVKPNWSADKDFDCEALQWQKQEHGWEIACMNNTTKKPSPIWTIFASFCMKRL